MAEVRIATLNLENFDETAAAERPSLAERIELMRPQIVRLRADIVCFQEVNGQERDNEPRSLLALSELLAGTNLAAAHLPSTRTANNEVFDQRNLVVATTFPVLDVEQLRNDLVAPLSYRRLTAIPPDAAAVYDRHRAAHPARAGRSPRREDAAPDRRAPQVEDPDRHPWPED